MVKFPLTTAMPLWFILCMSVLYQHKSPGGLAKLQSPGGLANISITTDYLWFIIPMMIANFIALAVQLVHKTVKTSTWEKVEEHARKAIGLAKMIEVIGLHSVILMVVGDDDISWGKAMVNWCLIPVEVAVFALFLFSLFYPI